MQPGLRRLFLAPIVLCALLSHSILSQARTFHVRQEDSQVEFAIYKWMVFKEEGRFRNFDGTITYDPKDPSALAVSISVDIASVDSRNTDRDSAIRGKEFLNASQFPSMTFRSVGARSLAKDSLLVEGDLTIRGKTKRVHVPVRCAGMHDTRSRIGTLVGFEATFVINKSDFEVAMNWPVIGEEVTIHLLLGAGTSPIGRSS